MTASGQAGVTVEPAAAIVELGEWSRVTASTGRQRELTEWERFELRQRLGSSQSCPAITRKVPSSALKTFQL